MNNRYRILIAISIMVSVAILVAGVGGWGLYRVAIEEQGAWLIKLVKSQARMIEAVALFDADYSQQDHPEGATAATITQVLDAYKSYDGFGETGEFVIGKRDGEQIIILDTGRRYGADGPTSVSFGTYLAKPMYLAIKGMSGMTIGPDYRGVEVLAAYEPVAILNIGIVAKIDLAEIRAPFITGGIFGGFGALIIIIIGGVLTHHISAPLVKHLEIQTKELQKARDEAVIANKAKSEFLANMSHELRTPLNAILGFSEVLANETFGPLGKPKNLESVTSIYEAGTHLTKIIGDILDISKIEANEVTVDEAAVDIERALKSCVAMVTNRAEAKNVTLKMGSFNNVPFLHADEQHLKQIIINLLSNAVKFTPAGGQVSVRAGLNDKSCVEISVTDTGVGIAAENIPKVMQPFGQVASSQTRSYEGTGLGLPICKSLMELHGGSLDIESEIDKGTTVTMRFPPVRTIQMQG